MGAASSSSAYRELLKGLHALLQSGLPILEALRSLAGRGGGHGRLAQELLGEVERGKTLAEALGVLRARVPPEQVALVEAGEGSGKLVEVLERMGDFLDRRRDFRRSLAKQAAYPACVFVCGMLLPPLFLLVQGRVWEYVRLQLMVFVPIALLSLLVRSLPGLLRSPAWGETVERILLAIPFVRSCLIDFAFGQSFQTLGMLLEAGLGYSDGLPLAARSSTLPLVRRVLLRAEEEIRGGSTLSGALEKCRRLRQVARDRIATGEEAGALDRALSEVGRELEASCASRIRLASKLLPVLLYLLAGVLVFLWLLKTMTTVGL